MLSDDENVWSPTMLSQAVGYAATALGYVAAAGGKAVLVREVAEACDIPGPYLSKIVHALSRTALVLTQRGVGGGVTLSRDARTITLYDLCARAPRPDRRVPMYVGNRRVFQRAGLPGPPLAGPRTAANRSSSCAGPHSPISPRSRRGDGGESVLKLIPPTRWRRVEQPPNEADERP